MGDLSPSKAWLWTNCSAAPSMNKNKPNRSGPAADIGTALHWVASEILSSYKTTGPTKSTTDFENMAAPNGILITPEHLEGVEMYVNEVLRKAQKHGALQTMFIEQKLQMPSIDRECSGTCDAFIYVPSSKYLYIYDFKTGKADVSPFENPQLVMYANGAREFLEINGMEDQVTDVVLIIVQPFAFHAEGPIRTWATKLADLRGFWNKYEWKAHEVNRDPKTTTGAHCKNCASIGMCASARQAAYRLIDLVDAPMETDEMLGEDLATERRILKTGIKNAQQRLDEIEEIIRYKVSQGDQSTGLALSTKKGRLKWKEDVSVEKIKIFCKQFGAEASKESLKTPKQTLKTTDSNRRIMLQSIFDQITEYGPSTTTLIDQSDSISFKAFKKQED